jgi:hypothetical protein
MKRLIIKAHGGTALTFTTNKKVKNGYFIDNDDGTFTDNDGNTYRYVQFNNNDSKNGYYNVNDIVNNNNVYSIKENATPYNLNNAPGLAIADADDKYDFNRIWSINGTPTRRNVKDFVEMARLSDNDGILTSSELSTMFGGFGGFNDGNASYDLNSYKGINKLYKMLRNYGRYAASTQNQNIGINTGGTNPVSSVSNIKYSNPNDKSLVINAVTTPAVTTPTVTTPTVTTPAVTTPTVTTPTVSNNKSKMRYRFNSNIKNNPNELLSKIRTYYGDDFYQYLTNNNNILLIDLYKKLGHNVNMNKYIGWGYKSNSWLHNAYTKWKNSQTTQTTTPPQQ